MHRRVRLHDDEGSVVVEIACSDGYRELEHWFSCGDAVDRLQRRNGAGVDRRGEMDGGVLALDVAELAVHEDLDRVDHSP